MNHSARVGALTLAIVYLTAAAALAQSKPSEWDKVVEAGRKEGKVVASIPPTPELRKLMEITFMRRYGIATEFVPARGGAIIQRMVSEAKANMQYFDLHIGGTESVITGLLPENVLDSIDPYLPLSAGTDILGTQPDPTALSAWAGFLLFLGYALAALAVSAVLLVRRDA